MAKQGKERHLGLRKLPAHVRYSRDHKTTIVSYYKVVGRKVENGLYQLNWRLACMRGSWSMVEMRSSYLNRRTCEASEARIIADLKGGR